MDYIYDAWMCFLELHNEYNANFVQEKEESHIHLGQLEGENIYWMIFIFGIIPVTFCNSFKKLHS